MNYDIKRHEGDNLGGNYKYAFVFEEDIDSIPEVFEGAIHTEIKLKPGKKWNEGYGTEGTMDFDDEELTNEHGNYFVKKFSALVPKNRADITHILNSTKNKKFILLIYDNNEEMILVGTKSEPLYVKWKFSSKKDVPERNEHELVFSGEGTNKSPIFKGLCPLKGY